jgi:hypothetical protein
VPLCGAPGNAERSAAGRESWQETTPRSGRSPGPGRAHVARRIGRSLTRSNLHAGVVAELSLCRRRGSAASFGTVHHRGSTDQSNFTDRARASLDFWRCAGGSRPRPREVLTRHERPHADRPSVGSRIRHGRSCGKLAREAFGRSPSSAGRRVASRRAASALLGPDYVYRCARAMRLALSAAVLPLMASTSDSL